MLFFKKHKTLNHQQCSAIGFVLAVLSLLSTAFITFCLPLLMAWLNMQGVFHLDFFLLGFIFTLFVSVQALLLFGFPLFYAQDKKSNMTGFQILLYAFMWMLIMVALLVLLFVALGTGPEAMPSVNDFVPTQQ